VSYLPISDKNTRTLITLPKKLKEKLEEEAAAEKRSFNNYVLTILENRQKK
jgi:predicted HicB family RNase H-like nuclease